MPITRRINHISICTKTNKTRIDQTRSETSAVQNISTISKVNATLIPQASPADHRSNAVN